MKMKRRVSFHFFLNFLFSFFYENTIYKRKHHLRMNKNELDKQLKKERKGREIK